MTLNDTYRIEDLAKVYQDMLGNSYYSIDVYSNLKVDGNIIQGIIKPYRRPFKLSNIKAETVELILEFYISVRKNKEKLDELSDLAKICGLKKGTFTSNNKTYTYHSFLDFASPANAPVADFGDYTQVVILNGTCLVSEASGGAMVSNELKTEFIIDAGTANEISDKVEVLSYSFSEAKQTESPQIANSVEAKSYNKSQSHTYSYTIIVQKNALCKRLIKAARNIVPFGLNEVIKVKDTFPEIDGEALTTTTDCVVTDCSLIGQAGAFVTLALTLQDVLVLSENYYEI